MKLFAKRKMAVAAMIVATLAVAACSTEQVIDNSVGVAAGTTKVVAKGAIGAGKLAYKGGKMALGAGE